MNQINGICKILYLFIIAILLLSSAIASPIADTVNPNKDFGMRVRQLPLDKRINAPVIIQKAPTNEATIVKLATGELKIFFINRPGMANKMMSISSTDHGFNWTEPRVEFDLPGEAYYANQVIQGKDGTVHCIFHIFKPGQLGYRGRHLDLWYASMEPGKNWTTPRMIWEGYVGSVRGFIELKNGSLLIPMSESDTARANKPKGGIDYGLFQVISLHSENKGTTWTKSVNSIKIQVDPDQLTRYGAVEPVAIELKDGKIWMLIRTNKGHLYESYSGDGGKTWEDAKQTSFISSDSPASLLRLNDGAIVFFLNSDQRYDDKRSYANGGREALHVAISTDETLNWQGFREVLVSPAAKPPVRGDRGTAYPSAVETTNGNIVFVSGQGEESAIVIFNRKWLIEKNHKDEKGQHILNWTMHGTPGNAGVWNFPMAKKGELTISLNNVESAKSLEFALTDHFSVAHDTLASGISPFRIKLSNKELGNKTNILKFQWDVSKNQGEILLNGKKLSNSRFQFSPTQKGFNYLRVTMTGDAKKVYEACSVSMQTK